jgi:hypothetical protein
MSFKLRQASGTYTQTLRLALLATRIIVVRLATHPLCEKVYAASD